MASVRPPIWCISRIAILKWIQMICSLVVVLFISDGRYQWFVYTLVYLLCILLIVFTFLSLTAVYLGLPNLDIFELLFNLIAFLLCLLAGSVLTYDAIRMVSDIFSHHRYLPPISIGREGWKNRVAVCTVFLLLETLFYLASFVLEKRTGLYQDL